MQSVLIRNDTDAQDEKVTQTRPNETLLIGGRTTLGVVRVGDTVRRPLGSSSHFVSHLLRHLVVVGFDGVPRALGRDDQARDILTWIDGDVPSELSTHSDEVLAAAARLIRYYHDATAALVDSPAARAVGIEVVCHNDLSPCNFVFRTGLPVAIIDFDAAAPGTRCRDLGYAAWLWLDLGNSELAAPEQIRRFRVFLDAYGSGPSDADVVSAMLDRQVQLASQGRTNGNPAMTQWADDCRAWVQRTFADIC